MRPATVLLALALALVAPAAQAAPDLRVPDLAPDASTDAACEVVVPANPGRGVVCAVEIAFCLANTALARPCVS